MVVLDKLSSGFLSYALYAADIIGTVTHKCFQVDKLDWCNSVILGKFSFVVFYRALCCVEQYGRAIRNKLERVPVPCENIALILFVVAKLGKRTENVVSLVPLTLNNLCTEGSEQFLNHRHLLCKLVGHTVTVCLVTCNRLVAESWCTKVEGNSNSVGVKLACHSEVDIHKSCQGICVDALFVGQHLYSIKCTVHNAVTVYGKQFHSFVLLISQNIL